MQQDEMGMFVKRFDEVASDNSDYSGRTRLQGVSRYDIRAAAEALWVHSLRKGVDMDTLHQDLNERAVIQAMLAQERRYDDEDELVSVEFEGYWDATDRMKFSSSTLDVMREELVRSFLAAKRREGYTTVSNRDGIWLFRFEQ